MFPNFFVKNIEEETEKQVVEPSNEVLEEDKRKIKQYLKTKKYQLTLSLKLNKKESLKIKGKRIYSIRFKNADKNNGKASIIIDNNGNIELSNFKIFDNYRKLKRIHKPKTYDQLLAENTKYKKKIKEVQKILNQK